MSNSSKCLVLLKLLVRSWCYEKATSVEVKSNYYYYFWGAATVAVVLGQVYVGTGYRLLHGSMLDLLDKVDGVLLHKSDKYNGIL